MPVELDRPDPHHSLKMLRFDQCGERLDEPGMRAVQVAEDRPLVGRQRIRLGGAELGHGNARPHPRLLEQHTSRADSKDLPRHVVNHRVAADSEPGTNAVRHRQRRRVRDLDEDRSPWHGVGPGALGERTGRPRGSPTRQPRRRQGRARSPPRTRHSRGRSVLALPPTDPRSDWLPLALPFPLWRPPDRRLT